jgi:hypothetical protein
MDESTGEEVQKSSTAGDSNHPSVNSSLSRSKILGWASLVCASIFPFTFWIIVFAEKNRLFSQATPGGKIALTLFLVLSSFFAIFFGLLSLAGGVRKTAVIGMVIGLVELIMCLMSFRP